jgi:integrase
VPSQYSNRISQGRAQLVSQGRIDHDAIFFKHDFRPIPHAKYSFERWYNTLKRLPLRYRKPYTAPHTSVSWNLMLGKNSLWVAKQRGHRIATMLSVYAAWVDGARECDIAAIRRAMGYDPKVTLRCPRIGPRPSSRRQCPR